MEIAPRRRDLSGNDLADRAASPPVPEPPGTDHRLAYQPALDGVRAVSILVVLAFHLEASWMPGGYLGVSVFFTLSGYLITSLLLAEHRRTGGIALVAFYLRRGRRLLPAALVCLAGVGALAAAGVFGDRELRPELLGALAQVANWEALIRDRPYAELFLAPSPVAHFWSLAIEEQFYWVWPLVVLGLATAVGRRGRHAARGGGARLVLPLAAGFVLLGLSAPLTARWLGPEAVYLASWARFAEILAGAVLAAVLAERAAPRWCRHLALPALGVIVVLCVLTPSTGGWPHAGGLPLFSLLTVALVLGLQHPGRTRAVLSLSPFVGIGRVSYGLYLYHWPVIVVLDGPRTGLEGPSLAALRLGVTLAITVVSYVVIEQPIRTGARMPVGTPRFGWAVAAASFAVVALAIQPPGRHQVVAATAAPLAAAPVAGSPAHETPPAGSPGGAVAAGTGAPPTTSVALLGDSLLDWLLRDAAVAGALPGVRIIDGAHEGCDGVVDRPPVRDRRGRVLPVAPRCEEWPVSYAAATEGQAGPVDVAVAKVGGGALLDHRLPTGWTGPCEDMSWYVQDVRERLAWLQERVPDVVVLLPSWLGRLAGWSLPDDHPQRMACVREQMSAVADELGLRVLDLALILCPEGPTGDCGTLRSRDGVHVDPEHADEVLAWLIEQVTSGADHRTSPALGASSPNRAVPDAPGR